MSKKSKEESPQENVKQKARDIALATIEKQYGKGAIIRMDSNFQLDVPFYGTGITGIEIGRAHV